MVVFLYVSDASCVSDKKILMSENYYHVSDKKSSDKKSSDKISSETRSRRDLCVCVKLESMCPLCACFSESGNITAKLLVRMLAQMDSLEFFDWSDGMNHLIPHSF